MRPWLALWLACCCVVISGDATQPDTSLSQPVQRDPLSPPPLQITEKIFDEKRDSGAQGKYPTRTFVSSPVQAPDTNFLQWSPAFNDGRYLLLTPQGKEVPEPGPLILDGDGQVVWSAQFPNHFGGQTYNLKVQNYHGEDFLTFWSGDDRIKDHGFGQFYMLNASYDIVRKVGAANGAAVDYHEFTITPEGTALVIRYEQTTSDTTAPGHKFHDYIFSTHHVWESIVQEIDIESGMLIFEWRASSHVNLTQTYREMDEMGTQSEPFDWFQVNSVEKDELGNYLISARYTHAIYYINGRTGDILWTLGGRDNQFMDLSEGHALNFAWQHDARFRSPHSFPESYQVPTERPGVTTKLITLFDNAGENRNYAYGPPFSRGMLIEICYPTPGAADEDAEAAPSRPNLPRPPKRKLSVQDTEKVTKIDGTNPLYTVRLIQEYVNPEKARSSSQGSVQLLEQGVGEDPRVLVGFGLSAIVTEFHSNGSALCDMHFGARTSWEKGDVYSYRAHKSAWIGRPQNAPVVILHEDEFYISWNGSTEVRAWLLEVSDHDEADATWIGARREFKSGFETALALPAAHRTARFVRIVALDAQGQRLPFGVSTVIDRGRMKSMLRQHVSSQNVGSATLGVQIAGAALAAVLLRIVYRCATRRRPPSVGGILDGSGAGVSGPKERRA